jgi:hypothetical protein
VLPQPAWLTARSGTACSARILRPDRRLFRYLDCSDLSAVGPDWSGDPTRAGRNKQSPSRRASSGSAGGPARSLDRWLALCAGNQGGELDRQQVERLDAVVLSLQHLLARSPGWGARHHQPSSPIVPTWRQRKPLPARSRVLTSEQSRCRNNRCCSDIGTTPIRQRLQERAHDGRSGPRLTCRRAAGPATRTT